MKTVEVRVGCTNGSEGRCGDKTQHPEEHAAHWTKAAPDEVKVATERSAKVLGIPIPFVKLNGPLPAGCTDDCEEHHCGSELACPVPVLRSDGTLGPCEFGTRTVVTFHEPADIEAEVGAQLAGYAAAYGKPTEAVIVAARLHALAGKNLWSQEAEDGIRKGAQSHGEALMADHAAGAHPGQAHVVDAELLAAIRSESDRGKRKELHAPEVIARVTAALEKQG